jgi:hypothetical protein
MSLEPSGRFQKLRMAREVYDALEP